jgi:Domain of unknown function (DUF4032)
MQNINQAHLEADDLSRKVLLHDWLRRIRNQPNSLIPFDAVKQLRPSGEHYVGHQTIEVAKIVGSTDRYDDFDARFLPKDATTLTRWKGLRAAQLDGKEFPPIDVYKVGEVYFVKDGNHRTALARTNHQVYIDALVTELDIPVELDTNDTIESFILKGEYAAFLDRSRLPKVCADHLDITFSKAGRYEVLYDHIRTHRYFMGINKKRTITREEAVLDWYQNLYLPTVQEIQENDLLKDFPGRTEADLYLWISDHRYFLSKAIGHDVGLEAAAGQVQEQAPRGVLERVFDWFKSFGAEKKIIVIQQD